MKVLNGLVVSVKMQKTAVIEVVLKRPHPLYGKIIKRNRRYLADTGDFNVNLGDEVKISQAKPISKRKHFKIVEVGKNKTVAKISEVEEKKKKEKGEIEK